MTHRASVRWQRAQRLGDFGGHRQFATAARAIQSFTKLRAGLRSVSPPSIGARQATA